MFNLKDQVWDKISETEHLLEQDVYKVLDFKTEIFITQEIDDEVMERLNMGRIHLGLFKRKLHDLSI